MAEQNFEKHLEEGTKKPNRQTTKTMDDSNLFKKTNQDVSEYSIKNDLEVENANLIEKFFEDKSSEDGKQIIKVTKVKKQTRLKSIRPNLEGQYQCHLCSYRTYKREGILVHIPRNHGPKKFKCESCDFKSRAKGQLKDHVGIKHLNVRNECDQCEYKANYKHHLVQHKISQHVLNVKISCTMCEYFGKSRTAVKRHVEEIHKI